MERAMVESTPNSMFLIDTKQKETSRAGHSLVQGRERTEQGNTTHLYGNRMTRGVLFYILVLFPFCFPTLRMKLVPFSSKATFCGTKSTITVS